MSIVSNNIKYLRRLNGLTQEQFARKIAIKRSLLGAYEEARANPNLTNLKNMAAAFGITVDNLLKNDLRKIRETPELSLPMNSTRPMTVSHSGAPQAQPSRMPTFQEPQPLSKIVEKYQQPEPEIRTVARQVTLKPVDGSTTTPPAVARYQEPVAAPYPAVPVPAAASVPNPPAFIQPDSGQIPVFNNHYPPASVAQQEVKSTAFQTIQWVSKAQREQYIHQYQNPAFLTNLPTFQLPNLPSGYYRAFESGDDFTYPGAILIGTFIRNWYDIKDGGQYLFVMRNHGVIFRTAYNQVKTRGELALTSSIETIPDIWVALHDVLEVWEIKAFVCQQMPLPVPSVEKINHLVDELQQELSRLR
jgi:transcriptional regulator with XRE-family HTH domain